MTPFQHDVRLLLAEVMYGERMGWQIPGACEACERLQSYGLPRAYVDAIRWLANHLDTGRAPWG